MYRRYRIPPETRTAAYRVMQEKRRERLINVAVIGIMYLTVLGIGLLWAAEII